MGLGAGGAVAIKRLNTFYNAPDQIDMILDDGSNDTGKAMDGDVSDEYVVYMKDVTFKWPKLKKKKDEEEKKDDSEMLAKADKKETAEPEGHSALTANGNGSSYGAMDGDAGTNGATDGATTNGIMRDESLSSEQQLQKNDA